MDDGLAETLREAIAREPLRVELRLQLAVLLIESKRRSESIAVLAQALAISPGDSRVQEMMSTALQAEPSAEPEPAGPFNWEAAEAEVGHIAAPMFVDDPVAIDADSRFRAEQSTMTLADVGGLTDVKERLNAAFLAPLKNPELQKLYGKSMRGGLLMYGPPGCGKTFIARAVAGELGAKFISVGLADILDPYIGQSEQNVHALFQLARREAPCVVFLDEIDTLGQRRSGTSSALRGTVNQLLTELDGVSSSNEGVFVLAATNQPWDVDPAMRRPGRLDRTVLVLPPDAEVRVAIFRYHLSYRPVEAVELEKLAAQTEGFSGADIAYVCEVASEIALTDSVARGIARMITMSDLRKATSDVHPSIGTWLESARTVVTYGDDDGTFSELRAYLKKAKRL